MSAPKGPLAFVILASGKGTNAQALMKHALAQPQKFQVQALVSDRADAPALDLAQKLGVATHVIPATEDAKLLQLLATLKPRWACLAGYRKLVSKGFLEFFRDQGFFRVLNVHPSLLPAYPGLHGYKRAFQDGVRVSGVTVHFVDEGLDTGLAILQEAFAREESDTLERFTAKGQAIEHRLFAHALDLIASGRMQFRANKEGRWLSLGENL